MAATARTPRVQLVLNLQHDGPQEHVLRRTDGHEVVEAWHGGVPLRISRKRKAPPPAAPASSTHTAAAARSHAFKTPAAARALTASAAAAVVAAESPFADELVMPKALGQRIVEGLAALPDRAAPGDRLLAICAGISAAAVEDAERQQWQQQRRGQHTAAHASADADAAGSGAHTRAAVLADALADFQRSLAEALAAGRVALAGAAVPRQAATVATGTPGRGGREEGEVEQPDYHVDLEARKAGLRARLANFQKEEAEWHALLQKVEQLDQQLLAGSEAAGDGAPAEAAAAPGSSNGKAAPEAAAAAQNGGLSSVGTEPVTYDGQLQQPAGPAAGSDGTSCSNNAGGSGTPEDLAALARLHAGVHRHLAMQVEGMCKVVGDAEELVDKASRLAAAVQAEYHAEKFRAFPHVDSPARLIRALVRGPAGASSKAAAAVEAAGGKENAAAAPAPMVGVA